MELVILCRRLWRRRVVTGIGIALAVMVAVLAPSKPAGTAATAWTGVILNTRDSEVVKAEPFADATLSWRETLLAALMQTDSTQQMLATTVGVPASRLAVVDADLTPPQIASTGALAATKAATPNGASYVLTVDSPSDTVPMIGVEASAPDRAGAIKLVDAAVAVLQSRAPKSGTYHSFIVTGSLNSPSDYQPFVVSSVAPIRTRVTSSHKLSEKRIGAALFVLLLWWATVKLASRVARRRERAGLAPTPKLRLLGRT
ncbi:MAG TPA: hypothetical protein VHV75_12930 [Solirubrobacteraceae bacterium]|nr:hypothetical protein [Solirubrobacteraceae bacterium]